mgnify:CR=1 FL=1
MTEYIKKHYRLILMSVFAALVCFGYQAFNSNIRIDTEELINHPGSTLGWLTIGRFGLVLLKRMLGLGVHRTIKSGILMLLFFILGGNVLTYGCYYFSGKKDGKPYWNIYAALYDIQYLEFSVLFFTAAGGSRICNAFDGSHRIFYV